MFILRLTNVFGKWDYVKVLYWLVMRMRFSTQKFKQMPQHVVCFGGGKEFDRFCDVMSHLVVIDAIVDNNSSMHGKYKVVGERHIPIIAPCEIQDRLKPDSIIMITVGVASVCSVVNQLCEMDGLEKAFCECSIFAVDDYIRSINYDFTIVQSGTETSIPKIIHYAWFGKGIIPEEHQRYIDGWKRLCPDYEVICWNEHNYDIEKNRFMKRAYEEKKWGFVPDYLRKDVIFEYGGIYLDTDVELRKSLDTLLAQDGFCAFERSGLVAFGLGFGAKKGLAIMKVMRDFYDQIDFDINDMTQMTGPMMETRILEQYGLVRNLKKQRIAGLTVYPPSVLNGTSFFDDDILVDKDKTFAVHHYAGSWLDENEKNTLENMRRMYLKTKASGGTVEDVAGLMRIL